LEIERGGGEKWVCEGDANTQFFHLVANGRRRKKTITMLESEGVTITDQNEIREAIYAYYRKLFGAQPETKLTLGEAAWAEHDKLDSQDNASLLKPITEEELKETIFRDERRYGAGP